MRTDPALRSIWKLLAGCGLWLACAGLLAAADGLDAGPGAGGNLTNEPPRRIPAVDRLRVQFSFATFTIENDSAGADNGAKNPDNGMRSFGLAWRHRLGPDFDCGAVFERLDGEGWHLAARGWLRFGDDEEAAALFAGAGLLKNTWDDRTIRPVISWGAALGSTFGSLFSVAFDNMGPIPWAPGFSVGENSGFAVRGQLDLSGLALFGGCRQALRSGPDADSPRKTLRVEAGLALVGADDRFAVGYVFEKACEGNYIPDGSGSQFALTGRRERSGLRLGYDFRRRSAAGPDESYAFALEIWPHRTEESKAGARTSSDKPEFAFSWSGSFAL